MVLARSKRKPRRRQDAPDPPDPPASWAPVRPVPIVLLHDASQWTPLGRPTRISDTLTVSGRVGPAGTTGPLSWSWAGGDPRDRDSETADIAGAA